MPAAPSFPVLCVSATSLQLIAQARPCRWNSQAIFPAIVLCFFRASGVFDRATMSTPFLMLALDPARISNHCDSSDGLRQMPVMTGASEISETASQLVKSGTALNILITVGLVSPFFSACARIFNSIAALPTSPLVADAASLLMVNSIRDAFFTWPRSRNSVLAFRTFFMISPTSKSRRLPRPFGLGQVPFLN